MQFSSLKTSEKEPLSDSYERKWSSRIDLRIIDIRTPTIGRIALVLYPAKCNLDCNLAG